MIHKLSYQIFTTSIHCRLDGIHMIHATPTFHKNVINISYNQDSKIEHK